LKVISDESSYGYFGIGVMHLKNYENLGTLWRSASILGAAFIFTIDHKYSHQSSDVQRAWTKIPLYQYKDFDHFYSAMPHGSRLIGVEMEENAIPIKEFEHPPRGVYLLGSEANGLPPKVLKKCNQLVSLPGVHSLNVSVAGSIIMFDRVNKGVWK
jgi:tRNA G18 (ribose-2'-O)-methylase SpoU